MSALFIWCSTAPYILTVAYLRWLSFKESLEKNMFFFSSWQVWNVILEKPTILWVFCHSKFAGLIWFHNPIIQIGLLLFFLLLFLFFVFLLHTYLFVKFIPLAFESSVDLLTNVLRMFCHSMATLHTENTLRKALLSRRRYSMWNH